MTTKVRIKVGGIKVDYEGPEDFLDSKLPKLISDVATIAQQAPAEERDGSDSNGNTDNGTSSTLESETSSTLASFLRDKKASNQTQRFLATAQWLHLRGFNRIKTSDVTKALRASNQKKLSNPSDCLRRNCSQGFCEKDGKAFFVTDEGQNSLA